MKIATLLMASMIATSSLVSTASRAENKAADVSATVEGDVCSDEATLNDMQAARPLICTDGKWRKVVFKTDEEGNTSPLFYEGKCSFRFTEGGVTKTRLSLKGSSLADVCLPVGWRVHFAATDNSAYWIFSIQKSMPNVLLIKSIGPGQHATLWVYPSTPDGKSPQKIEVQLRSVK